MTPDYKRSGELLIVSAKALPLFAPGCQCVPAVKAARQRTAIAALSLHGPHLFRLEAWGARVLSDQRERPRRSITPDPLPDGESGEVQ